MRSKLLIIFTLLLLLSTCIYAQAHAMTVIKVPDTFESVREWNYIDRLINSDQDKVYRLVWQGWGGEVSILKKFLNSVKSAQKKKKIIIIDVVGDSNSCHAMGVCSANKTLFKNNAILMFHSVSWGFWGFEWRVDNSDYKDMFDECVKKNIIPSWVYDKVQAGYIVYVNPKTKWYYIVKDDRLVW